MILWIWERLYRSYPIGKRNGDNNMSDKDYKVIDRQIIVSDNYFGHDELNEFFSIHKLRSKEYNDKEITMLIESVAYLIDYQNNNIDEDFVENSDILIIEKLLEK